MGSAALLMNAAKPLRGPSGSLSWSEVLMASRREASECLVGSAVFKTVEGSKDPWWVRFPSASAIESRSLAALEGSAAFRALLGLDVASFLPSLRSGAPW